MDRPSLIWKLVAVVLLALGALLVVFGMNLMPTQEVAVAKGSIAPWRMTWGMIWATVAMTIVLAGYLFSVGRGKGNVENAKLKT
ncbi:MAG TPA: hypothetical protein VKB50_04910 [Vicinamibacterales bacterium]|nr:hypothetical protein [Vicinamibacterales bacterium]